MIKASELRVGNLVKWEDQNVSVLELKRLGVELGYYKDSIGFLRNYKDVQPIPLTEEWLLKFGLEWSGKGAQWLTKFTPCGKALVYIEEHYFKFCGITIEIQIKYVHQLQNLYFALTGEELTIKQ